MELEYQMGVLLRDLGLPWLVCNLYQVLLKAPAAGHRRTHHNLRILLSLWAGFSNVALQSYRQEGKQ